MSHFSIHTFNVNYKQRKKDRNEEVYYQEAAIYARKVRQCIIYNLPLIIYMHIYICI